MVGIMDKIVLLNYCLSAFLSRGKKDLIKNGTWFLFANELFFIVISLVVLVITRFDFRISNGVLLLLLITIWGISFYGTKDWLLSQIEKRKIDTQYKILQSKTASNTLMGSIIFVGSFLLFLFIIIKTFEGYLI